MEPNFYNQNNHSPSPFRSKHKSNLLVNNHYIPAKPQQQQSVYSMLQKKRTMGGGGFTSQGNRQALNKTSKPIGQSALLNHTNMYKSSPDKKSQNSPEDQEEKKESRYSSNALSQFSMIDGKNSVLSDIKQKKEIIYCKPGVKIGQGKYHAIELIIYQNDLYALKKIPKSSIDKAKRIEHLKNEKNINYLLKDQFRSSSVKWFVSLEETFVDADSINFIFEYLPGADLFWVIQNEMNLFLGKQKQTGQSREWIKFYAAEILIALEILHKQNIIYRDLKPENVMVDKDGHIKLIDFGFAKRLSSSSKHRTNTNCGTLGYSAPEVIMGTNQGYSFPSDIWSFGILLCELIQGSLPFENKEDPQMIEQQTMKGEFVMPREADSTARDLITQILVLEPNLRLSIDEIKAHKYFAEYDWKKVTEKQLSNIPYKPNPLKYKYLLQNKYPPISSVTGVMNNDEGEGQNQPIPAKIDSPKKNLLGDFTLYKINKEFENF
ncbi:camp dependent protein kinase a catalytic subunit [Stylonychia lemnae]|uniref:non-specific serine/threonine protein kinase n=1 Tax=Stylonychia lemnae TaxID=5949 RepID=A0A078B9G6_STYLE|nr:camp dependent protein kinase a catalytic subunit [Stylonychia lemnae]|eukprot:CDW91165.1 camp dependent protein kinase a catalytic subunit [Stylonychia lemnae]